MLHRTLSILPTLLLSAFGLAQVPNNGFESWNDQGDYLEPDGWVSSNALSIQGGVQTCERTTPGQSGDYCVTLSTRLVPGIGVVGGTLSVYDNMNATFGFPLTSQPEALNGYWKYNVANGDMSEISVVLNRWNAITHSEEPVAAGFLDATGVQSDWTSFSVPLDYIGSDAPDTANIFILSSATDAVVGTTISVDGLTFGTLSSVPSVSAPGGLRLFPSPATDVLHIAGIGPVAGVTVLDLAGRAVMVEVTPEANGSLQVGALPAGIYIAAVRLVNGRVLRRTFSKG